MQSMFCFGETAFLSSGLFLFSYSISFFEFFMLFSSFGFVTRNARKSRIIHLLQYLTMPPPEHFLRRMCHSLTDQELREELRRRIKMPIDGDGMALRDRMVACLRSDFEELEAYKEAAEATEEDAGSLEDPVSHFDNLDDDVMLRILGFCDVLSLERAKLVSKRFLDWCTKAINKKPGNVNPWPIEENYDIHLLVKKYMSAFRSRRDPKLFTDRMLLERFAQRYGWPMGKWNVSWVTDFSNLFNDHSDFNENISEWNTSGATIMCCMFHNAQSFNQPLDWDVSGVTNMSKMFVGAANFNQPLDWDVSGVTNMSSMFAGAASFNQPLDWDVSGVTNMSSMFAGAASFNQPLPWNVGDVIAMPAMFSFASSFNQNLRAWNISPFANNARMFEGASSLEDQHRPLDGDKQRWSRHLGRNGRRRLAVRNGQHSPLL